MTLGSDSFFGGCRGSGVALMATTRLRTFCFLDSMQPQFASFQATVAQGYLPVAGQAALFVEVAPGMEIQTHG